MNLAQEKALLFGSPPSLFRNLSLFYTNVLFKMPWLSVPLSDEMLDLLALPERLGGIALTNPTSVADQAFHH